MDHGEFAHVHLTCVTFFCVVSIVCWESPFGHCFSDGKDSENGNWKIPTQSCCDVRHAEPLAQNFSFLSCFLQREGLPMEAGVLQINWDLLAFAYFPHERRCMC